MSTKLNEAALRTGFEALVEQLSPVRCNIIQGQVPSWLNNTALYRTTPSMYQVPVAGTTRVRTIQHWFDGLGAMHQFHIRQDGSVWYNNRFTATGARDALTRGESPIMFGSVHDPCLTIFGKVGAVVQSVLSPQREITTSNLNVTVSKLPFPLEENTIAVKSDFNCIQLVDSNTFETRKFVKYSAWDKVLDGAVSAAHEEFDPVTNTYFNLNIDQMGKRTALFSLDEHGKVQEALIDTPRGRPMSYIHSFSSTSKYLVLTAWPCFVNILKLLYYHDFSRGLEWQPEKQCLFYVVDRSTMTHVATFESTKPFFCFHTVNAFDDGDDIVLDLIEYENMDIIHSLAVETILSGSSLVNASTFARYRLPNISSNRQTKGSFAKVDLPLYPCQLQEGIELPTINEKYRHHGSYTFVYTAAGGASGGSFFHSLVKLNIQTGQVWKWTPGAVMFPGEAIFVANPNEDEEDAGVLLSVVLDGVSKTSSLFILDAKDLTVVARIAAPVVVPLGFHGMHTKKN